MGAMGAVVTGERGPVDHAAYQRRFRTWRMVFAVAWLAFLLDPLLDAWAQRDRLTGWIGILVLLAFVGLYLPVFAASPSTPREDRGARGPRGTATVLGLLALTVVMIVSIGPSGAVAGVYVGVLAVVVLPSVVAGAVVAGLAVAAEALARQPAFSELEGLWIVIASAAFAAWGIALLSRRNGDLLEARAENERLVVDAERHRMARDLHDILGHSLTVITVKSELTGALLDAGTPQALERARAEVADLERLARDALADVRATAHGYRHVSLPAELARAAEALRACAIEADLPGAADAVPTHLRELFAWTVREGVTNVVRHSGARRCSVTLEPDRVRVCDDGSGTGSGSVDDGAGIVGLRERAAVLGATVTAGRGDGGFVLEVAP